MLRIFLLILALCLVLNGNAQNLPVEIKTNCAASGTNATLVFSQTSDHLHIGFMHRGKVNTEQLRINPLFGQLTEELLTKRMEGSAGPIDVSQVRRLDSLLDAYAVVTMDSLVFSSGDVEAEALLKSLQSVQMQSTIDETRKGPGTRIVLDGYTITVLSLNELNKWGVQHFNNARPQEPIYQLLVRAFTLYRKQKGRNFLSNTTGLPFAKEQ